jgi:glucose-6-phosphate isomerase
MSITDMKKPDFNLPCGLDFDMVSGLCGVFPSTKRYLSDMKNMFSDESARDVLEKNENSLVYEFYELDIPKHNGDIAFGTSIVYPGKVGIEYFMTKGHFHNIIDTAEIYICLRGHGYMLLENREGIWDAVEMVQGRAVYCPKGFAHRSINIGGEPLVTFYAYRGDAGHDYGSIEEKGYRKRIIEHENKPVIINNTKWE